MITKKDAFPAIDRLILRQVIDRYWMRDLSASEYKVLSFIFDRTIGWGKLEEQITIDHIAHGVPNACRGSGLSRSTVMRVLQELERKGGIRRRKHGRDGDHLRINFAWRIEIIAVKMFATTVRRYCPDTASVSTGDPCGLTGRPHKNSTPQEGDHEEHDSAAAMPPRDHARGGDGSSEATSCRTSKPDDLRPIWERAWAETYPGTVCSAWSPRERGQVRNFAEGLTCDQGAFFDWVVRSWATIVHTRLWWMTERPAPECPRIPFLVSLKDHFIDAWNDRATLHQELNLTGEQRQIRRFMREGMTHEAAKAEVERLSRRAEESDRLAQQRAELGREARALARERQRLRANPGRAGAASPPVPPLPEITENAFEAGGTIASLPPPDDGEWD